MECSEEERLAAAIPSDDADPPSGPEPALRHLPNDDSVRLYGCRVPAETTQMGCFGTESIHDLDRTYQLDFRCHNLPVNVVRLQMSVGGDAGPLPVRVVRRRIAVANADRTYDTYTQGSFFPKPCFMARHDNDLCSHGNRHPDSVHSLRYVHRTGYATMGLFPLADSHTAGLLCIDTRCKKLVCRTIQLMAIMYEKMDMPDDCGCCFGSHRLSAQPYSESDMRQRCKPISGS